MNKNFFKKNERPDFYSLLIMQSELGLKTMELFIKFNESKDAETARQIDEYEKEADKVRKQLVEYVESSFITPLDRHDLFAISRRIDDIADKIKDLKDFIIFFDLDPIGANDEMCDSIHKTLKEIYDALNAWADGDDDEFWDHISDAKKNGKKVKLQYWQSLKTLETDEYPANEALIMKEFFRELSMLSYKTKKAIDRISDTKIKSIM